MRLVAVGVKVEATPTSVRWERSARRAARAGVDQVEDYPDLTADDVRVEVALPETWDGSGWLRVVRGDESRDRPPPRGDAPGVLFLTAGAATGKNRKMLEAWVEEARDAGVAAALVSPRPERPAPAPERAGGKPGGRFSRVPNWIVIAAVVVALFAIASWFMGYFFVHTIESASGFPVEIDGSRSDREVVTAYFDRFDEIADGAPWLDAIEKARVRAAGNDVTIYTTLDDEEGQADAVDVCYAALDAGADDVHVWGDKVFRDTRLDGSTEVETVEAEIVESTLGVCQDS